jgi:Skp family chaperone for outer membrane proteins
MKPHKHLFTALTLAALTVGAWAQTETASDAAPPQPSPAAPATPASPAVTLADIQELKAALAAQQQQIQALQAQLQSKDQALEQVRSGGPAVTQTADTAPSAAPATVRGWPPGIREG